jgi:cAMP-dependent protein kinase regulator
MTLETMDIEPKRKRYIIDHLNPILEEAVGALIAAEPADPETYLIEQFSVKAGGSAAELDDAPAPVVRNRELHATLAALKEDMRKQVVVNMQLNKSQTQAPPAEEEEEDPDDDIPEPAEVSRSGNRTSVSAEAYGAWNAKKTDFKPPVYDKSKAQADRLREILTKSFIFGNVDDKSMQVVIEAMHKVELTKDEKIISEGENGDYLFVVDEGELLCYKDGNEANVLKTCVGGDVFGELALLYNCPRAASVVAKSPCLLWKLDRETFGHITSTTAEKTRDALKQFLAKVPILESVSDVERSTLADVMIRTSVTSGTEIVRQGDAGDLLYFVEEGTAVALKDGSQVMSYARGDYFGELALLNEKSGTRQATVKAVSDVRLVSLKRADLSRLLGSLEQTLLERASAYV